MGKKIYEKKCHKIDLGKYTSFAILQNSLEEELPCGSLNYKHLEALTIYLWEVENKQTKKRHLEKLSVSKGEKCPVCGMFLYKYPTWIAKIVSGKQNYYFDGNKDMFKYYFEHMNDIKSILVQEYYTHKTLTAKDAVYVIGSDVYGPMGHELIAFATLDAARKFLLDHRGQKVLNFQDIDEDMVYSLDD